MTTKKILLLLWTMIALTVHAQQPRWVGTWACAPQTVDKRYMPYNNNMSDRSVRQIVKVSIGGEAVRLQLSNVFSSQPVEIRSVYIAHSTDSFSIHRLSARYLHFSGRRSVTIPAGQSVFSDELKFRLEPMERVAITINYYRAPALPTVHMGSRTTSYIMRGLTTPATRFGKAFREDHWFNIAAIDVVHAEAASVAIIGNSITDGKASTTNGQDRWPDIMSDVLNAPHRKARPTGVLNLGIGNNRVLSVGLGEAARDRFDRDILAQRGVRDVVVFEGINDLGTTANPGETARQLIAEYQKMIQKAHARGLRVFGGTIMPFRGCRGYYTEARDAARRQVNDWIRTTGELDGVLDFDALMRDPSAPDQLRREWQCGDWLHPNPLGYRQMGEYAARVLAADN
ncbi:SGNH/GDSL hydrolase family protein [Prevotella dentasini]|uniref:SGNH/GDSL hydrolase family protein n=1 Tax=Prevotella dentasini TaxID=589537 RepID=UPI000468EC55|nr:SGNH/GDSL hydrolase family protein [Prevotella dentasini]